jgi:signal transduction histidine kinase
MKETVSVIALAEVLSTGVALVSQQGVVRYANPAFSPLFFATPLPPGSTLTDLSASEHYRGADALWHGEPGHKYRCRLGGDRMIEGSWHLLGDERAVVVTDVTRDAQIRQRLREHNRTLAELVATKSELVSALLHELRTPLTAARSMAQLLPESLGDPLLDQAAHGVGRNLERLEHVILEMATISGIENGTIDLVAEPVDLARLLAGLPADVSVTGNAPVTGDPGRLAEVFRRLITAVEAIGGPQPLPVIAREEAGQWRVALSLPVHGAVDQLFTTTGAGSNATALMLARAVVRRHGGMVGIESEDGKPCLMVRLPALTPAGLRPDGADRPG